jgi:hypothetical protein
MIIAAIIFHPFSAIAAMSSPKAKVMTAEPQNAKQTIKPTVNSIIAEPPEDYGSLSRDN